MLGLGPYGSLHVVEAGEKALDRWVLERSAQLGMDVPLAEVEDGLDSFRLAQRRLPETVSEWMRLAPSHR
eukprot:2569876-Amphidinium_carterae.1